MGRTHKEGYRKGNTKYELRHEAMQRLQTSFKVYLSFSGVIRPTMSEKIAKENRRSSVILKSSIVDHESKALATKPHEARRKSRITMVMEREELEDEYADEDTVLANLIDEKQLSTIHEMFMRAPKQRMDTDQFKRVLETVLHVIYDDLAFELIFKKIDSNRDEYVGWGELLSYLMLEFQEKYIDKVQVCFDNPIGGIPRIYKTHHHFYPIVRITFYPDVLADRSVNYLHGNYLTCSTNGTVNYWSLDMEQQRCVNSKSPYLKVTPTWVTDMICLPDVRIVCISSTERELRFYDTTAKQFELRVVVHGLEHAVVCMYYHFNKDIEEDSMLICGDTGGNIRIFTFNTYHKGPFYHKPGVDVQNVSYERVLKGLMPNMEVKEFKHIHQDWVKQVSYNTKLNSFVSCAVCPENSVYMRDTLGTTTQYVYHVIAGVTCFCIEENAHLIVTGSPDCIVRLWSAFVPQKATCIFQGHHSSIVAVIFQKEGRQIISISKDRCVKVWDVAFQNCIQTYAEIPATVGGIRYPLNVFYNPLNHSIFVGSMLIAVFIVDALVSEDTTDGTSHLNAVAAALYNPLFKVIVSVGSGSMIMVWNPWKGKRQLLRKHAHTVMQYGQLRPVEITAATFDPCWQLLLTGAYDGSLKIWNFNTGTCLRNMCIDGQCEVSSVVWIKDRILAVGWNRHVVEWADTEKLSKGKSWETRHSTDILCATHRYPQCLATSSYNGELVLWRLETGTAYKKYQVTNPTGVCTIDYIKKDATQYGKGNQDGSKSSSTSAGRTTMSNVAKPRPASPRGTMGGSRKRYSSTATTMRTLSVHAMIFLTTRPMQADTGTLLVALENGQIQMWSHHNAKGFVTSFHAIHAAGDYITSMETDIENRYLFTGTTMGYVKIWLMANYCLPYNVRLCMPKLRLQFPFLWADRIQGRAKRAIHHQPLPVLLSSYRGHLSSINRITYISGSKILVTASSDYTVRLWTLGGRYIGTLGTYHPWTYITPEQPPMPNHPFRIPPDIKRVGSFTTLRVLQGGMKTFEERKKGKVEVKQEFPDDVMKKCVYGKPLTAPILGKYFTLPSRPTPNPHLPVLDRTMPRIPVFCHLKLHAESDIPRPVTPELVKERRHHDDTLAEPTKSQTLAKSQTKIEAKSQGKIEVKSQSKIVRQGSAQGMAFDKDTEEVKK